jgi:hypothetical protein
MIKLRQMRLAGHIARIGAKRKARKILIGKPEGKIPSGRRKGTLQNSINKNLMEIV